MIVNDPSMTHCPKRYEADAAVKLLSTRDGKYCQYHGKITEKAS